MLAYGYDRESTAYSRNALESLLKAISRDPAVGEISILAHSMGNSLALETLRQMAIRDGRVAPKIRNVLLAAPDVDVDLAREAIIDMGPRANRPAFTLFVSQDDRALAVSRRVWGSEARLGAINPDQEPYRTQLEQANVHGPRPHQAEGGRCAQPWQVRREPRGRPTDRQAPGRGSDGDGFPGRARRPHHSGDRGRGEPRSARRRALAVSAPVAIVDPQTRQSLGGHVENLGRSLSDTVAP